MPTLTCESCGRKYNETPKTTANPNIPAQCWACWYKSMKEKRVDRETQPQQVACG